MPRSHKRIQDIASAGLLIALMAVCGWITIPTAVPFTLQTLGIFTTLGVLGGRRGSLAVGVYLLMGMIGIPVFSGFKGGIGALLTPTGGYIVGFLFAALAYWLITYLLRQWRWKKLLGMVVGQIVCYIVGTVWFMLVYAHTTEPIGLITALGWCVFPFILPDTAKILAALWISQKISALIPLD